MGRRLGGHRRRSSGRFAGRLLRLLRAELIELASPLLRRVLPPLGRIRHWAPDPRSSEVPDLRSHARCVTSAASARAFETPRRALRSPPTLTCVCTSLLEPSWGLTTRVHVARVVHKVKWRHILHLLVELGIDKEAKELMERRRRKPRQAGSHVEAVKGASRAGR